MLTVKQVFDDRTIRMRSEMLQFAISFPEKNNNTHTHKKQLTSASTMSGTVLNSVFPSFPRDKSTSATITTRSVLF